MNNEIEKVINAFLLKARKVYNAECIPFSAVERRAKDEALLLDDLRVSITQIIDKAKNEEAALIMNDINKYECTWNKSNPSYSLNTPPSHNNFVGFLFNLIKEPIENRKHERDERLEEDE